MVHPAIKLPFTEDLSLYVTITTDDEHPQQRSGSFMNFHGFQQPLSRRSCKETYFSQFNGYYFTGDGCRRDKDWMKKLTPGANNSVTRVPDIEEIWGLEIGKHQIPILILPTQWLGVGQAQDPAEITSSEFSPPTSPPILLGEVPNIFVAYLRPSCI